MKKYTVAYILAGLMAFGFDKLSGGYGAASVLFVVLFGSGAIYLWCKERQMKKLVKTWQAVQGEITSVRTRLGSSKKKEYAAVVTVHTEQGDTEIIDHKWQKEPPQIGGQQEVRLNPQNPTEGFVYRDERALSPILFGLCMAGLISFVALRVVPNRFVSFIFPGQIRGNGGLCILYLMAWGWLLLGVGAVLDAWLFFRRALLVEGKVTSFETQVTTGKRGQEQTMYAEVISFPFENGTRNVTGSVWTLSKPKMGMVRKVGIRPDRKNAFRVYSWVPYIAGSIFGIAGLVTVIVLLCMK